MSKQSCLQSDSHGWALNFKSIKFWIEHYFILLLNEWKQIIQLILPPLTFSF